jgi:hypothetical protein
MALRSFVDELSDPSALKPILPQLMNSIFKLMSEVSTQALECNDLSKLKFLPLHRIVHMGAVRQTMASACESTCCSTAQ